MPRYQGDRYARNYQGIVHCLVEKVRGGVTLYEVPKHCIVEKADVVEIDQVMAEAAREYLLDR